LQLPLPFALGRRKILRRCNQFFWNITISTQTLPCQLRETNTETERYISTLVQKKNDTFFPEERRKI
jgi:hypothetical protein